MPRIRRDAHSPERGRGQGARVQGGRALCIRAGAETSGSPRSAPEEERSSVTNFALSPSRVSGGKSWLCTQGGRPVGSAWLRLPGAGRWVCEGSHRADAVSLPVSRAPKDPQGLLPSSPGLLPWHEVGTRPGWASGARLGVLPAGADLRSLSPRASLGQGPPSSHGSWSSDTKERSQGS